MNEKVVVVADRAAEGLNVLVQKRKAELEGLKEELEALEKELGNRGATAVFLSMLFLYSNIRCITLIFSS